MAGHVPVLPPLHPRLLPVIPPPALAADHGGLPGVALYLGHAAHLAAGPGHQDVGARTGRARASGEQLGD